MQLRLAGESGEGVHPGTGTALPEHNTVAGIHFGAVTGNRPIFDVAGWHIGKVFEEVPLLWVCLE